MRYVKIRNYTSSISINSLKHTKNVRIVKYFYFNLCQLTEFYSDRAQALICFHLICDAYHRNYYMQVFLIGWF